MPNRLVVLQNMLHLVSQIRVDLRKPFGQVLMHRALGHAKFLGDRSYCMPRLHDAAAYLNGTFLDVIMHAPASQLEIVWYSI
ncbi:hypothetical protein D3C72_2361290 [compost metagenome]